MRLPWDLTRREPAALLRRHYGYEVVRQTGSHLRLATVVGGAEHRVTIPAGGPLRVGTLAAILAEVAAHLDISPPGPSWKPTRSICGSRALQTLPLGYRHCGSAQPRERHQPRYTHIALSW